MLTWPRVCCLRKLWGNVFNYRSAPRALTKKSPATIMIGSQLRYPLVVLEPPCREEIDQTQESVEEMRERIAVDQETVKEGG